MRPLTRLMNAFSKKFVRVHSKLRVTPAMESGITTGVWVLVDLLEAT